MDFITVKNLDTSQRYRRCNPPWIKLHGALLDDYAFCALDDAAKGHLVLVWLYASQHNGKTPSDLAFLERKLCCTKPSPI